jgi:hypothetical protein
VDGHVGVTQTPIKEVGKTICLLAMKVSRVRNIKIRVPHFTLSPAQGKTTLKSWSAAIPGFVKLTPRELRAVVWSREA